MFLDRRSPAYVGGAVDFLLTDDLREAFLQLPAAVRKGGTALPEEGTVSHDNRVWVAFAHAMAPLMQMPAQMLADLIADGSNQPSPTPPLKGGEKKEMRVLDVAAGHGMFGIAVAQRYPNAHITALDWPAVLEVAAANARRAGIADRHALLPGSAFETDWRGPYDIILLTNFLHHFDLPTCQQLAAKAHAALAPQGRALTLEFIPEPDRITPTSSAGFALTMLATTPHGDAYTFAEYDKVFATAGFRRSEFHPLPPTTQQAVVSYKG